MLLFHLNPRVNDTEADVVMVTGESANDSVILTGQNVPTPASFHINSEPSDGSVTVNFTMNGGNSTDGFILQYRVTGKFSFMMAVDIGAVAVVTAVNVCSQLFLM